jgi:hypothetical protein
MINKKSFGERMKFAVKGVVVGTLLAASLVGFSSGAFAQQIHNVTVKVNGYAIAMNEAPAYIDKNSQLTYVPLRFVSEALGAEIGWVANDVPISATVTDPKHHEVKVLLDEKKAEIDGTVVQIEGPPVLQNGRTMVPLRIISEGLGAEVKWVPGEGGANNVVDIKMPGAPIPASAIEWTPIGNQKEIATQVFKLIRFDIPNQDLKINVPSVKGKQVIAGMTLNGGSPKKVELNTLYDYKNITGVKLDINVMEKVGDETDIADTYHIYSRDVALQKLPEHRVPKTEDLIVVDQYKNVIPLSVVLQALGLE